jgi:hypothetical protein
VRGLGFDVPLPSSHPRRSSRSHTASPSCCNAASRRDGAGPLRPGKLLDAAQLGRRLGVTRAWVYEHATELGAVALGDGPKARLRFDPAIAEQVLEARRRGTAPTPSKPDSTRTRRRRQPAAADIPLLPIHSPRARSIFARVLRSVRRP